MMRYVSRLTSKHIYMIDIKTLMFTSHEGERKRKHLIIPPRPHFWET